MIDTSSNPDVISSRTWTAIFLSLIAFLSLGSYVQAAADRHVRDNVFYGNSHLVTPGTPKDFGKSKESDKVIGHLRSTGGNDVSVQDTPNNNNSPALNSFLENVLKAQNELKWIDQAVRHVDAGEKRLDRSRPWLDRFGRRSDLDSKDTYQAGIRVKRDLEQVKSPDASWVPLKKRYENDYHDFPERVYLDNELKFKRDVDPEDFQEDAMNLWASGSDANLGSGPGSYKNVGDKDSRDERHLDSKHRKLAGVKNSAASQNPEESSGIGAKLEEDPPSLESLKKVVLELSKSLTEPDTKTEARKESVGVLKSKNVERHVEEMTGRKEGPSKGEHERDASFFSGMNQNFVKPEKKNFEKNDETDLKWWDDPRSAAEIFDFKGRDDREDDEEDEEMDGRNSEFDYVMRRVKRDRNDKSDDEENGNGVGVFYRAGFGEYYPNDGQSFSHRFRRDSREDLEDLMEGIDEGVDTGNYNDKIGRGIKINSQAKESAENDSKKIDYSEASRNLQDQEKNLKDNKMGLTVEKSEAKVAKKEDSVKQEELSAVRNKKGTGSNNDSTSSKSVENQGSNVNSVDPESSNFNKKESLKIISVEAKLETGDTGKIMKDENSKISDTLEDSSKDIKRGTSNVKKKEETNIADLRKIEKSDIENKHLETSSPEDPRNKKSKDEDTIDARHVPETGENPLEDDNDDKKRITARSQVFSISKRPEETLAKMCRVEDESSGKDGVGENVPEKLISTILDINVQEVQLGSEKITEDARPRNESVKEDKMRLRDVFDLYKDKDNPKNIQDSKVNQDDNNVQNSSNSENRVQRNEVSENDNKDHVKSQDWYADLNQSQEKEGKEASLYEERSKNEEQKNNIKEKRNYQEKNQKERVDGPASEKSKYQDKEYDQGNLQSLGTKSTDDDLMKLSEDIKDSKKDTQERLSYKDTERKILWVTSMIQNLKIRDGRRDSSWDQKESEKHERGPVNVKENFKAVSSKDADPESEARDDFKDDLNTRELKDTKDLAPAYTQRQKRQILQEVENGPEFHRSQFTSNLQDASVIKKRSQHPKDIPGPQEDSNLKTGVKGPEGSEDDYEGVNEDIKNIKKDYDKEKSEVNDQGINDFERDERSLSAYERDPLRDRVNMLIRQRIDTKAKAKDPYIRRRRYPLGTIEYYDYDSDSGEYEKDSAAIENEQKPEVQQQQQQQQPSNSSANDSLASCKSKITQTKKDENSEEEMKEEKQLEKLKNKVPKQEFIADVNLRKGHAKVNNMTMTSTKVPCGPSTTKAALIDDKKMSHEDSGKMDESDEKGYREYSEGGSGVQWLGQSAEDDLDHRNQNGIIEPENRRHVILAEPLEYNLNVHGKLEPEVIGAILGDGSPVKQRLLDRSRDFRVSHGILSDYESKRHQDLYQLNEAEEEVQPTYEELEKINEWKQSEIRERPRLRGDQRMFSGPGGDAGTNRDRADTHSDRAERRNWYSKEPDSANPDQSDIDKSSSHLEQFSEQISKERRFLKEAKDEVPKRDSQDMLKREPAAGERTYLVISPAQVSESSNPDPRGSSSSSSPGSNYMALKITDDMFKGGIEQSNPTEEKTPEILGPLKTTTEWKVIKVMDNKDNTLLTSPCHMMEKEKHNLILQTDSRSPYENQRILKSLLPPNDNNDFQDRSSVGSKDLMHESFVEPLDLDSEDDARIRLGRGLMAIDDPELEDLHSFSYPADDLGRTPSRRAVAELEWQEAPVDKYLKNSQDPFFQDDVDQSWIEKKFVDDDYLKSEKKDRVKREVSIDSNDRSIINFENHIDIPNASQGSKFGTRIGKGLTNVDEWEMNAPMLQRHVVSANDRDPDAKRIKDSIEPVSIDGSNVNKDSNASKKAGGLRKFASQANTTPLNREKRNLNYNEGIPISYFRYGANNFMENENVMNNFLREKEKENEIRRIPGFLANSEDRILSGYGSDFDLYKERKDTRDETDVNLKNVISSNDMTPRFFGQNHVRDYHHSFGPWSESNRESGWLQDRDNNRNNKKTIRSTKKKTKTKDRHSKKSKIQNSRNFRKRSHRKQHPSSRRKKPSNVFFKNSKNHGSNINFKSSASSLTGNLAAVKDVNTVDKHPLSPTECKKILESQMSMTDTNRSALNAQNQSTSKTEDDSQKKKFTVLLAPDNMEDESQMDIALHGELAGKIVERIFDQVQSNEALKVTFGPGLYRKHKPQDIVTSDKVYRQGLDEDEVKHTETMMRRVMELLGRLILDEVQRKTCASLPPDMEDFLQWMLGIEQEESSSDQSPPSPLVHDQVDVPHHSDDKFLFRDPSQQEINADVNELYRKVRLLKSLINEYNALTQKEKTKVQTVHDYLVRQLALLVQYIEAKEAEEANGNNILANGERASSPQHILQYQNAMSNSTDNNNRTGRTDVISTFVSAPGSITRSNNATFRSSDKFSNEGPIFSFRDNRRKVRSSERLPRRFRKRKRKRKRKHRKKHKHSANQSPEYRKLIRRIALLRQKRADSLYQENRESFESGYEEPIIYSASGMPRSDSDNRKGEAWNGEKNEESMKKYEGSNFEKEEKPRVWSDEPKEIYNEADTERDRKVDEAREKDSRSGMIRRKVKYDEADENTQNVYADRADNSKNDPFEEDVEKNFQNNFHTSDSQGEYRAGNGGLEDIDYENDISRMTINSPESYSKKKRQVDSVNYDPGVYVKFENEENIGKTNDRKRDVLSASVNLQPWLDPKSKDESTLNFLRKFSDQLVRASNVNSETGEKTYKNNGEKRDALEVYEEKTEPRDLALSGGGAKNVKRSLAEDEVVLLNKREAWKRENERQLEEVAFGKDMRSRRSKEEFEKLAELDERKKVPEDAGGRKKRQDEREDESKITKEFDGNKIVENTSKGKSECHGTEKNLEMICKAVDLKEPKIEKKEENLMTMEVNIFKVVPANLTKSNYDRRVPEEGRKIPVDYLKNIEEKINVYSDVDSTEHTKLDESTKQNLDKIRDNGNGFGTRNRIAGKDNTENRIDDESSKINLNEQKLSRDFDKNLENYLRNVTEKTIDKFSEKSSTTYKRSFDENKFQEGERSYGESENDETMRWKSGTDRDEDKFANEVSYFNYPSSNEDQPRNYPIVKDVQLNFNEKDRDSVQNIVKRNGKLASNKNVRSRTLRSKSKPADPAAISPLLEVSEQRRVVSQASRARKYDRRDTADRMLG